LEDVSAAVNHIIGRMIDAFGSGNRVEVRGFGGFSLRQRGLGFFRQKRRYAFPY
jgi:nucleoid DNA-binding protein